jgi:hypothetical protein
MSHAENKGRAEGRTEREREMARNAIQMGMPMNQVSQLSGLSDKELMSLKQNAYFTQTPSSSPVRST